MKDKNPMIIPCDKIWDPFIIKTLSKVEVEGKYLNIIKSIYDKPTANIILNGKNEKRIPLRSGTGQGWSLLPHLYFTHISVQNICYGSISASGSYVACWFHFLLTQKFSKTSPEQKLKWVIITKAKWSSSWQNLIPTGTENNFYKVCIFYVWMQNIHHLKVCHIHPLYQTLYKGDFILGKKRSNFFTHLPPLKKTYLKSLQ